MRTRDAGFVLFFCVSVLALWVPLKSLVILSFNDDSYSHAVFIPIISLLLIWLGRARVFSDVRCSIGVATALLGAGILCFRLAREPFFSLGRTDNMSLMALGLVLIWMAGFNLFYGFQAFRASAFPLLLLLLVIPIPNLLLTRIVAGLQQGSGEVLSFLLRIAGVPFLRNGLVFSLPGVSIRIAPECSGIRSSMALFITGLLAGHFFLRAVWRQACLILFVVPIVVLKNAIRIATISLLSAYVDRGFLTGNLHHHGGIVFSVLSVAMLVPILGFLQWSERCPPEEDERRAQAKTLPERSVAS